MKNTNLLHKQGFGDSQSNSTEVKYCSDCAILCLNKFFVPVSVLNVLNALLFLVILNGDNYLGGCLVTAISIFHSFFLRPLMDMIREYVNDFLKIRG